MKQEEINEVVEKLRTDEKFRDELLKAPVKTLNKSGYKLTKEQEAKLSDMDQKSLKSLIEPELTCEGCSYHLC